MVDHIKNRQIIINEIRKELVGPSNIGKELDTSKKVEFPSWKEAKGPWVDKKTKQEILINDLPAKRYGVGILFPYKAIVEDDDIDSIPGEDKKGLSELDENRESTISDKNYKQISNTLNKVGGTRDDGDKQDDGFEVSLSNSYRPCSMGISFLAKTDDESTILISGKMARYKKIPTKVGNYKSDWWLREPIEFRVNLPLPKTNGIKQIRKRIDLTNIDSLEGLSVGFELLIRNHKINERLIVRRQRFRTVSNGDFSPF